MILVRLHAREEVEVVEEVEEGEDVVVVHNSSLNVVEWGA